MSSPPLRTRTVPLSCRGPTVCPSCRPIRRARSSCWSRCRFCARWTRVGWTWPSARSTSPRGHPASRGARFLQPDRSPRWRDALDAMITYSDNVSTCLLLQQLHVLGQLDPAENALNRTFADLGMPTLQVNGTDPGTGARWGVSDIHMTAMDTARLLLLLQGGRLSLVEETGARPSELLTTGSRRLLLSLLADQGLHEVLSTSNWCGRSYPARGIPARVPARWIGADGTVTVDGIRYDCDVRPCNAAAEVELRPQDRAHRELRLGRRHRLCVARAGRPALHRGDLHQPRLPLLGRVASRRRPCPGYRRDRRLLHARSSLGSDAASTTHFAWGEPAPDSGPSADSRWTGVVRRAVARAA